MIVTFADSASGREIQFFVAVSVRNFVSILFLTLCTYARYNIQVYLVNNFPQKLLHYAKCVHLLYNVILFIKLSYTLINPLILNFDTTKKYRLKSAKHLYF